MYRKNSTTQKPAADFELPFQGTLAPDNRWVIMANLIPWSEFEDEYAALFSQEKGAPAKSFRLALGSLIIQEKLRISDRETVEQIRENPYLQYFIGLSSYSNEAPFEASMLVHFRKRINVDLVGKINKRMVSKFEENSEISGKEASEKEETKQKQNQGKLIADGTVAPADISYPTDLTILNQAREEIEKIIDSLYKQVSEKLKKKPRTYRERARKEYLSVAKKRRARKKDRRKAIKKQLQYLQRNFSHIEQLITEGAKLEKLSKRQYKMMLVVAEVYRQQWWMWSNKEKRIDDRIVSLSQPHIRPIMRGKKGKPTEFGAKLSVSCFNQYAFLDRISWNNFNESGDLIEQIEAYKDFTGFYPKSVHVDKIYRTRDNRIYCRERGIRMSGPALGRPKKNISLEDKKRAQESERVRNEIEGKFGEAKRRYGLNRVMKKLPGTSETAIAITFLVMNLSCLLRQVFCLFSVNFKKEQVIESIRLMKIMILFIGNNKSLCRRLA